MNRIHRWLCHSDFWRKELEEKTIPWVLGDLDLGQEVLEVGPAQDSPRICYVDDGKMAAVSR